MHSRVQAADCVMWTIKHCLIRPHGAQPPQRRDRYQQTLGEEMQSTRSRTPLASTPLAFAASRHAHCPGLVPAGSPVMLNPTPWGPRTLPPNLRAPQDPYPCRPLAQMHTEDGGKAIRKAEQHRIALVYFSYPTT